jgi:ADP-ribose pyrophosphatase YjhB (NUDIX family)
MTTGEVPTVRHAARVVLLDENGRVLLARCEYDGRAWWAAPGGGLERAETHEEAARREIREETGPGLQYLGPWIWTREHIFRFEGRLYRQKERYFLATVPAFQPDPNMLGPEEASVLRGLGWWAVAELEETADEMAHADLPALARELTKNGPSPGPIEVGI